MKPTALLPTLCGLSLATVSICSAASTHNFDIPEQALASSLIDFALQADITIVADNELLRGLRATAINGPQELGTALTKLVSGTALSYQYIKETNTYVIERKPTATEYPTKTNTTIEEVLVTGTRYPFRYNTITQTQQQSSNAYFDSSRVLNVIPQSLIQDQQAADLGDVLKFSSAITAGDGLSDSNDDMFIRGFQRHAIYMDGYRLSDTTGIKILPANIERIEILKGPSTLHYGQAEAGGIVNVVRKKPQSDSFIHAEIGGGTLGRQFANLDLNGQPFNSDTINTRVITAIDKQDNAGELHNIRKELFAPTIEWRLSDNTRTEIGYEYQHDTQIWHRNDRFLLPIEDVFDGATLDSTDRQAHPDFDAESNIFHAEINHYFTPEWRLTGKYFWQQQHNLGIRTSSDTLLKNDILFKKQELGNDFLVLSNGGFAVPIILHTQFVETLYSIGKVRNLYDEKATETANNASLQIDGTFSTGSLTHHLISGADWNRQDIYKQYSVEVRDLYPNQRWNNDDFVSELPSIAATIFDKSQPLGSISYTNLGLLYDDYGLYLQDSIELTEKWLATLGSRYTITTGEYNNYDEKLVTELKTYKNFSSQIGLTYQVTENNSLYTNYSEAMRANYHIDEIGSKIADPETSNQIELGLKSHLFNGKFLSNIALFSIKKENIVDLKLVEGVRTLLEAHEQEVQGIDIDATLQASSKINIIGSASFITPEIVSGEHKNKKPMMVADKTASLFIHYALLDDLAVNTGINYVSERFGDNANQFTLNSYSTIDLGMTYKFGFLKNNASLKLSAKNLLNEKYYTAILGGLRLNESDGRTITASLSIDL